MWKKINVKQVLYFSIFLWQGNWPLWDPSHIFHHISRIITFRYRAEQIMPLKRALINDKPAAASVSVMQSCVCMCGCVLMSKREMVRWPCWRGEKEKRPDLQWPRCVRLIHIDAAFTAVASRHRPRSNSLLHYLKRLQALWKKNKKHLECEKSWRLRFVIVLKGL